MIFLLISAVFGTGACSLPTVPVEVGTTEPIKVELDMRVDLYQHKDPSEKLVQGDDTELVEAQARSRNRLGEIQVLKNDRLAGENRTGYLSVRRKPDGDYGTYVEQVVAQENADRKIRMQSEAERRKLPLDQVQTEAATQNFHNAFSGEWVEVDENKDGVFAWQQKP